ncbi:uncharacterized protein LOC111830638 [Capsella rubella]|uniref:uncharacterized protein LOC111830638 n=1 Tax=Capsella rubella TaxID=81985 RepID=UPI000CD599B0|nr:uncharacterized protein LOC111830638 [Capsella rubella]
MVSTVPILTGTNFSEWKEKVEFTLGVLDMDLALREEEPDPLTIISTEEEKALHKAWEKANRLSMMFLRMTIASNVKTSLPDVEKAKAYLTAIEERFKTADKSLAGKLMADLTTIKYDGTRSMHEHCIEMTNLAPKLKILGMSVDDSFLSKRRLDLVVKALKLPIMSKELDLKLGKGRKRAIKEHHPQ